MVGYERMDRGWGPGNFVHHEALLVDTTYTNTTHESYERGLCLYCSCGSSYLDSPERGTRRFGLMAGDDGWDQSGSQVLGWTNYEWTL